MVTKQSKSITYQIVNRRCSLIKLHTPISTLPAPETINIIEISKGMKSTLICKTNQNFESKKSHLQRGESSNGEHFLEKEGHFYPFLVCNLTHKQKH